MFKLIILILFSLIEKNRKHSVFSLSTDFNFTEDIITLIKSMLDIAISTDISYINLCEKFHNSDFLSTFISNVCDKTTNWQTNYAVILRLLGDHLRNYIQDLPENRFKLNQANTIGKTINNAVFEIKDRFNTPTSDKTNNKKLIHDILLLLE